MIIRFLKVLWEWLFGIRGYLSFRVFDGSLSQMQEIALKQKLLHGKAKKYSCKTCGEIFWAARPTPTCKRISCFFAYRMKLEKGVS